MPKLSFLSSESDSSGCEIDSEIVTILKELKESSKSKPVLSLPNDRVTQLRTHEAPFSPSKRKKLQEAFPELKVICTIFDIGALNDPHIFQTLNVLLFFI